MLLAVQTACSGHSSVLGFVFFFRSFLQSERACDLESCGAHCNTGAPLGGHCVIQALD